MLLLLKRVLILILPLSMSLLLNLRLKLLLLLWLSDVSIRDFGILLCPCTRWKGGERTWSDLI